MEHAGDNAVHLSVGAEMEAYQAAADTVIPGPIAMGIQGGGGGGGGGEGLNEPQF